MEAEYIGAASRAAQRALGGIFTYQPTVVPVGLAAVVACPYNPNRVTLQIINVGTTVITLTPSAGPTSGTGILLLTNGSSVTLNYQEDADLPASAFYAVGNLAGGSLYVLEGVQAFPG